MSLLITILLVLVVAAFFLWALPKLPLDAQVVQIIRVVVVGACLFYLVAALLGYTPLVPAPRWR
jgi:hypothetical protein